MDNETANPVMPKPEMPMKKEGGVGPMAAIVIIVLLLVAGGIYYFTIGVGELTNGIEDSATVDEMAASDVSALEEQGTSDEIADIETDLNATDLSGLDESSADFESEVLAQ